MPTTLFLAAVIGISDGDTLTVLRDQKPVKIRLAEIDAPEKKQAWGTKSRQALSDLCFNSQAEIRPASQDRYGRTVARVTCRGVDASWHQVRFGMAWVYEKYATDRSLFQVQEEARKAQIGLWQEPGAVAPWVWRKAGKFK